MSLAILFAAFLSSNALAFHFPGPSQPAVRCEDATMYKLPKWEKIGYSESFAGQNHSCLMLSVLDEIEDRDRANFEYEPVYVGSLEVSSALIFSNVKIPRVRPATSDYDFHYDRRFQFLANGNVLDLYSEYYSSSDPGKAKLYRKCRAQLYRDFRVTFESKPGEFNYITRVLEPISPRILLEHPDCSYMLLQVTTALSPDGTHFYMLDSHEDSGVEILKKFDMNGNLLATFAFRDARFTDAQIPGLRERCFGLRGGSENTANYQVALAHVGDSTTNKIQVFVDAKGVETVAMNWDSLGMIFVKDLHASGQPKPGHRCELTGSLTFSSDLKTVKPEMN